MHQTENSVVSYPQRCRSATSMLANYTRSIDFSATVNSTAPPQNYQNCNSCISSDSGDFIMKFSKTRFPVLFQRATQENIIDKWTIISCFGLPNKEPIITTSPKAQLFEFEGKLFLFAFYLGQKPDAVEPVHYFLDHSSRCSTADSEMHLATPSEKQTNSKDPIFAVFKMFNVSSASWSDVPLPDIVGTKSTLESGVEFMVKKKCFFLIFSHFDKKRYFQATTNFANKISWLKVKEQKKTRKWSFSKFSFRNQKNEKSLQDSQYSDFLGIFSNFRSFFAEFNILCKSNQEDDLFSPKYDRWSTICMSLDLAIENVSECESMLMEVLGTSNVIMSLLGDDSGLIDFIWRYCTFVVYEELNSLSFSIFEYLEEMMEGEEIVVFPNLENILLRYDNFVFSMSLGDCSDVRNPLGMDLGQVNSVIQRFIRETHSWLIYEFGNIEATPVSSRRPIISVHDRGISILKDTVEQLQMIK